MSASASSPPAASAGAHAGVPVGDCPEEVDVLVIGSGFGGSVVAHKLAGEGRSVCVVERGKAYPPGSFPRNPNSFATNFWDPSKGLHGMYDIWSFQGLEAIVSSGLGGGSLIYANVMLRKPDDWFSQPHPYRPGVTERWSFDAADLAPHYAAVEDFLNVQQLPTQTDGHVLDPSYTLPKVTQFRAAAGSGVAAANLAVQFRSAGDVPVVSGPVPEPAYGNLFGVPRRTCRLCGECDIGCNEGSKNSLDHTYLSSARHRGATIHQRTEVRSIRRRGDGRFDVEVVVHRPEAEGWQTPTRALPVQRITAERVVVSAGTLGSTYLLLRSRVDLGLDNPALGTRFCGNGDLLGFILNVAEPLDGWKGPVITSYREYTDEYRMYIQDAAYPEFAAWLVELAATATKWGRLRSMIGAAVALARAKFRRSDTTVSEYLSALIGRPSVTTRGMPVLGMGMDVPDGTLYLRPGQDGPDMLDSTWTSRTSEGFYSAMTARMKALADELGGDFMANPTYRYLRRVITVHPVGGCPADTDTSIGVVDGFGRVRGVPGLRVCDGSVFPGPIGANPSLTIAAFADRLAEDMLAEEASEHWRANWPGPQ